MEKIINFLKDIKLEMSRVNWPTRQQTTKYTLIVIGMSIFLAIFLGTLDFIFGQIINIFVFK